jgi:hypothetical protein
MPRKPYRPKPVFVNAHSLIASRLGLVNTPANAEPLRTLRTINHSALDALRRGHGTLTEARQLMGALHIATLISKVYGHGKEYSIELSLGAQAVEALLRRGAQGKPYLFTGLELQAAKEALTIHDAQLDITTAGEIDKIVTRAQATENTLL